MINTFKVTISCERDLTAVSRAIFKFAWRVSLLTIWPRDLNHIVALSQQRPRNPRSQSLRVQMPKPSQRARPTRQLQIALRIGRNGQRRQAGALHIDRNSHMRCLMRIDADNNRICALYDALIAKNARASIREVRTVIGHPRRDPMRSLARFRGGLTVGTSTQ